MRWLLTLLLLFMLPAGNAVIINEIMYNPTSTFGGSTNEWLELYNNGSLSIDLTGWEIAEPSDRIITGNDLVLNSSEYLIIARNDTKFLETYNVTCSVAKASIALNNDGEWIALKDSLGFVVLNISYDNSLADGNNKTLSLANSLWRESLQDGGTPCAQNFLEHDIDLWFEQTCQIKINAHLENNGLNNETIHLEFYVNGSLFAEDDIFVESFSAEEIMFFVNEFDNGNYTALFNMTFDGTSKTVEFNFTIERLSEDVQLNISINQTTNEYWAESNLMDACLDAEVFVMPVGLDNTFVVGTLACFGEPDLECDTAWEFSSMINDFVDFGSYLLCGNILEIYNYNDTDSENNFVCKNFTIWPEATRKRIKTFVVNERYGLNETLYWTAQIFPLSNGTLGDLTINLQKRNSQDYVTLLEQKNLNLTEDLIFSGNYTIPDDRIEGIYKIRAKFTYPGGYLDSQDSGQFWLAGLKNIGPANFTILQMPASLSFGGFGSIFVKFFSGNFNYNKIRFLVYGYPSQVLMDTTGEGLSASDYNADVAVELENVRRGQEIYLALPAFAKQNCGNEYTNNIYRTRVRAYDEVGSTITVTDLNLQFSGKNSVFCPEKSSSTQQSGRVGGSTPQKQKAENLQLEITDFPKEVEQDESFTLKVKLTNNLNSTKSVELYSYIFQSQKLLTEGGWTGNKKTVELGPKETKEVELENKIKDDAELGTYTIRVRAKDGNKNIDSDSMIKIKEKTKSETATAGSGLPTVTGAAVYVSKTSSLNPALGLFVFLLLILVLVLIKSK